MSSDWFLDWDQHQEYIHFKELENEKVLMEFALKPPSHAKLYYALMDWFGDTLQGEREFI